MDRYITQHLDSWKAGTLKKPLIVLGARQIGKTYSLREFGNSRFKKLHEINLQATPSAHGVFSGDINPETIMRGLELLLGSSISRNGDEALFLDEIQECPNAITALKYFCESAPQIPVIAAGSLLGLHLAPSSFPVGKVDILYMYPMSFNELLKEHPNKILVEDFEAAVTGGKPLSQIAHTELWNAFKNFLCTGGLPEPVSSWLNAGASKSLAPLKAARKIIERNITNYTADIAKHAGKINSMHIERVWQNSATQLASYHDESTGRFKFKEVIPGRASYRDLEGPLDWLMKAHMLLKVLIAQKAESPLAAFSKENIFKAYLFDIGVLTTMLGLRLEEIQQFDFGTYKGYLAENFVATELLATRPHPSDKLPLYAWNEGRAEIEFLLNSSNGMIPIEVKSGHRIRSKSLQSFNDRYHPQVSVILSARLPEKIQTTDQKRINLPIYMTSALWRDEFGAN